MSRNRVERGKTRKCRLIAISFDNLSCWFVLNFAATRNDDHRQSITSAIHENSRINNSTFYDHSSAREWEREKQAINAIALCKVFFFGTNIQFRLSLPLHPRRTAIDSPLSVWTLKIVHRYGRRGEWRERESTSSEIWVFQQTFTGLPRALLMLYFFFCVTSSKSHFQYNISNRRAHYSSHSSERADENIACNEWGKECSKCKQDTIMKARP